MSDTMTWSGVLPAITTPFTDDDQVDHEFLGRHARWMLDRGCRGIITLGSLGEGATLRFAEKVQVMETCVKAAGEGAPVVTAISSTSTAEAVELARRAAEVGCRGLMVLPPYVHKGPWAEIEGHFEAVLTATDLPCMLYNNPIAYGIDVNPDQIADLASRHENLRAVKESSGDVRRVSAVRERVGDRLALFAGLDDMAMEAALMGANGWVAGLVNALPEESVAVFELARAGRREEAWAIYRWFLPLLRLDCVPEFVQLIKLVQAEVGMGTERVRAPRRPADGELRERTLVVVREHLGQRPELPDVSELIGA